MQWNVNNCAKHLCPRLVENSTNIGHGEFSACLCKHWLLLLPIWPARRPRRSGRPLWALLKHRGENKGIENDPVTRFYEDVMLLKDTFRPFELKRGIIYSRIIFNVRPIFVPFPGSTVPSLILERSLLFHLFLFAGNASVLFSSIRRKEPVRR